MLLLIHTKRKVEPNKAQHNQRADRADTKKTIY